MDVDVAKSALAKFDEYYRLQDKFCQGRFNDLGIEVRRRLVQMEHLLGDIVTLESECLRISEQTHPPVPPPDMDVNEWLAGPQIERWRTAGENKEHKALLQRSSEIARDLELETESFYWIAGRARSAIRLMPGLHKFEAEGVRNVRNKLLAHPEKADSGIVWGGFAWGAPQGPVIKALRYVDQKDPWPDAGLYVNAVEFFEALTARLELILTESELINPPRG